MTPLLFLFANSSDAGRAQRVGQRWARAHGRRAANRVARLWFALALFILLAAGSTTAAPLAEYRSRIHQALDKLYALWEEEEAETVTSYAARARFAFDEVKRLLPPEETVEWEGGRVKVNNSWLEEEFRNYQALPLDDSRRGDLLVRITERLGGIDNRLGEVEAQRASAAASTKEQEKARLAAILRRGEYTEKPPEKSLWERFKEWLASMFPSRNPLEPGQSSWLSFIAMLLIFGLAAGVLAYAVLKFLPFFKRKSEAGRQKRGARIVLGERLAPDQTAADLLAEAEGLARRGELRAAIRKGYIALLCELGDRKVITLAQHKTNHDYLRAVREKRPLLNEMQKLTSSFENHWYGFVPATPEDWTAFRSNYQQTLKTASLLRDEG
ncbi:MAG TPA: DUF4129 domain-containing protein [Pyrinomonadaceae bacterium]|nr:DUF4129 domain-containing protein [Pyrinomonadaceae bacterium]